MQNRSMLRLLGVLCAAAGLVGCGLVWSSARVSNPEYCLEDPSVCGSELRCNFATGLCEPPPMLPPPPDLRERSADVDAMQVVPDSKCGTDPWNPPRPVGVPIAFRAPTPLTTPIGLNTLASVDLNRDGRDDLVFANIPDNAVRVVYSNGNLFLPSAPSPVTLPATGTVPNGIATGNFNGDAFPDLAISYGGTSGAASVGVLLQGPVGQFSYFLPAGTGVLGSPAAIAATDLSGDGQDDLILSTGQAGRLYMLRGDATLPERFQPAASIPGFPDLEVPHLLATGTLAGGRKFVATDSLIGPAKVTAVFMEVALGFVSNSISVSMNNVAPRGVTVASLRPGDPASILVPVLYSTAQSIVITRGNGSGAFSSQVAVSVGVQTGMSVVADFNGDALPDIAVAELSSSAAGIRILAQKQDGTFDFPTPIDLMPPVTQLVVGDWNCDRRPDLAAVSSGRLVVIENIAP